MGTKLIYFGGGVAAVLILAGAAAFRSAPGDGAQTGPPRGRETTARLEKKDFVRAVRLSGTVEAVQSTTVAAPRLSGPNTNSLVITKLIPGGTTVKPGDLLVEFDRQQQITNALDRRAELNDLEQQIRKKQAEGLGAGARDGSGVAQATGG